MQTKHKILTILGILLLILCVSLFIIMQMAVNEDTNMRMLAAQRLGITTESSWEEIANYFDCTYLPVGMSFPKAFQKLSEFDGFLIQPVNEGTSIKVPYQGDTSDLSLSYYIAYVRFESFRSLNRNYYVSVDGTIRGITTPSVGLEDQFEVIQCN